MNIEELKEKYEGGKKHITVEIESELVWENGHHCTFEDAGLAPNSEVITDKDDIIQHFEERAEAEGKEAVITFV